MASEDQLPPVHESWLPREHSLYRPRHSGRQRTALTCALLFFVTPALLWVFGARPGEIENHRLASFPSPAEGWSMFTKLPAWATDHLVFRENAIEAADTISRWLFGEAAPLDQAPGRNTGPLPGSPSPVDPRAQGQEDETPQPESGYRRVVEGTDGWLYYGLDADAKCSPTRPIAETIGQLNKLRDAVEGSGRRFVLVVAPDKTTMVPEHLPVTYPGKDCVRNATPELWRRLTDDAGALDLRAPLRAEQLRTKSPLYSPNDTHWTDEAGLLMTRLLAERLQPGVSATWQTAPAGPYSTPGDLSRMLGKKDTKTNLRYDFRPDGFLDRVGQPVRSMDQPVVRREPPVPGTVNGRTTVFGDSFTQAAAPYLSGAFHDLIMVGSAASDEQSERNAIGAFRDSQTVVVQLVERSVAGGHPAFLREDFINATRAELAAHPVR